MNHPPMLVIRARPHVACEVTHRAARRGEFCEQIVQASAYCDDHYCEWPRGIRKMADGSYKCQRHWKSA